MNRRVWRWVWLALPVLVLAGVLKWQASWRPRRLDTLGFTRVHWLAWMPGGERLAVLHDSPLSEPDAHVLSLVQVSGGTKTIHGTAQLPAQVLSDGRIVTCRDDRLQIRSATGELAQEQQGCGEALAAHGDMLAQGFSDALVLNRTSDRVKVLRVIGRNQFVRVLAFSPRGTLLASGEYLRGPTPAVNIWNVRTGRRLRQLAKFSADIWNVAFSPDERTLAVSTVSGLTLWSVSTGKQAATASIQRWKLNFPSYLSFTPDGRFVAANVGSAVAMFNVERGRLERRFPVEKGQVTAFSFAPDGSALAVGDDTGAITLWRLK